MRSEPGISTRCIRIVVAIQLQIAVCHPLFSGTPPHLADEDLTATVRFEEDRPAGQLFTRIQTALRNGDNSTAVALLQEMLDEHPNGLIAVPTGYRSGLHEAWSLMRDLPPELIEHYRRHSGPAAETELTTAIESGDDHALIQVVRQFRFTESGDIALETLAQQRFDAADFSGAAGLYEELIRGAPDPRRTAAARPVAVWSWIVSLTHSRGLQSARAVADEFAGIAVRQTPDGSLEALVDQITNQFPPTNPPADASSNADLKVSQLLPASRAEWAFPFRNDASMATGLDEPVLREFAAAGITPFLQARPLAVSEGLIVHSGSDVVRLHALTGELEWRWPPRRGRFIATGGTDDL